ncbi:MFS transporter [Clostridium felsineum]|uniref:MFS transporter n=1 Tax=Clostridium felsineum TaxID=36839 RepID=UPI00098BF472|nr:MFS transporter [Clostridium felsineum]MCR3760354.1 MFS transporter [Clostridium felsineum]URZ17623.1 putative symporter YjmB [Clostridium felsineum DSM 794]
MKKLTLKEKISYGLGDFGNGFMFDLGQSYLLKFYTDVVKIAPGAAGGIFFFTKIFDAFMDPIAGTVVDSRKPGKHGKFRPIMFVSSIILAILTVITFTNPGKTATSKLLFAYITYMIWGLGYSFTNVPYGSLGSVITQDVQERTSLAAFRQVGSSGALLITSVIFMPLVLMFGNPRIGFPVVAGVMGVIGIISFYMTYKNTREVVTPAENVKREKITPKSIVVTVFTNRALLTLILMTIFSISAYNIRSSLIVYYCQYNLGNVSLLPYINFFTIGCAVLGVIAMPKLVSKFGKKRTAIIGFLVSVVADSINFLLPGNIYTFTILLAIGFIGISIPNGITWAFVSDSIDYGEWRTGTRREGITYSVFNFSRKLAQSIAGLLSGWGLGFVGYVANKKQSAETLLGIKSLLMAYPAVALLVAAIIVAFLYNLSDKKYNEMIKELEARKA